jgi:hypothetical protein
MLKVNQFGPKRDEVTGEWEKLHNEFNELYSSLIIVRVIKSRRMKWAEFGRRLGVILRWIFRKQDVGEWTGSSALKIRAVGGHV